MNKKEILEIKKQFRLENCNITNIATCLVNSDKSIISTSNQKFLCLDENEMKLYLDLFKKGLTGKIGEKMFNLDLSANYSNQLIDLKKSKLQDEKILFQYYNDIISYYEEPEPYAILLLYGVYDISGTEESVYEHIMCCICPISLSKEGLLYNSKNKNIEFKKRNPLIGAPLTSFLFPAFDNRSENVSGMLYYTKNTKDIHSFFLSEMFGIDAAFSYTEQKNVITRTFESLGVTKENIEALKEKMSEMDPTVKLSTCDLKALCKLCDIDVTKMQELLENEGVKEVVANNVVDSNHTTINMDQMKIQIPNELLHKVSIKQIDGVNCIVIQQDGKIHIDGIEVKNL